MRKIDGERSTKPFDSLKDLMLRVKGLGEAKVPNVYVLYVCACACLHACLCVNARVVYTCACIYVCKYVSM